MADIQPFFVDAIVLLAGAVITAPVFKRIGLGTVLGYLAAGVAIGPIIGFIRKPEDILHFAELGVVMLLFIIGLELKPSRLWSMRYDIFGLGTLQVVVTGLALALVGGLFLDSAGRAIIVGFGLALSSTAFALQTLEEAGDTNSAHGRKAFAILLLQDMAIVPLLALVPLFSRHGQAGLGWGAFGGGLAAIAVLILAGRYLLNPLFRAIAKAGAREVMIAAALFVVFGAAMLMQLAGMSMALGAFLAGVLLADSAFRHEIEANIEPFRGLLLGLFFMAIGMSLDLGVLLQYWYVILLAVPIAMAIKAVLIYIACRLFRTSHQTAVRVAAVLPQHGEFGFVLFSAALSMGVIDRELSSILIAIVILSMLLTPFSVRLGEKLLERIQDEEEPDEDFEGAGSPVLMIGFSRVGQVASQALLASGVEMTIIDNDPENIRNASRFGYRIYFGDGRRAEVLRAAGIEHSELVAICTHRPEVTTRIIELVSREWPQKLIYVRAFDRAHSLQIMDMDVDFHIRETFESALVLGGKMLEGLGRSPEEAAAVVDDVRRRDAERLLIQKSEGIHAGAHMLHTRAVKPEPLIEPKHEAEALDEAAREIIAQEEAERGDGEKDKAAGKEENAA
ncbi:MAG: monovalent cation:proton antiporter-2 (CPA2) family protein [Salaquimonas sp.]|nr:monovalent cation:proton antiporter-2 (CPA2) family protein [Salaquimonas sp.]